MHHLLPQALGAERQRGKRFLPHGPQARKHGPLPRRQPISRCSGLHGPRSLRHIARPVRLPAQKAGRRRIRSTPAVIIPRAVQHERPHGRPAPQQGLAVFHRKNGIGPLQQRRTWRAKPFQRPLPRRRERGAARKLLLQQRHKLRRQQRSRRSQQGLRIAALAAEAQRLRAAEAVEQLHAAVRKALCRAERIARRQLEHQRRPAANGSLGPCRSRDDSGLAPLDIVPAHHAHRRIARLPQHGELMGMAVVEGVVFADDSGDPHKKFLISQKSTCIMRQFIIE